ncbi:hypothetical protein Nepgr_021354 [Nepenthes gracilis]|uniref:Uncharacterized protein n=1 Tax=Nepenthes gracilis TaxID=150966 RepID=A0AAD3XW12_NEPGR|nr:hypothetical protein Nepgr_021354 [Nepenthes gracilis]
MIYFKEKSRKVGVEQLYNPLELEARQGTVHEVFNPSIGLSGKSFSLPARSPSNLAMIVGRTLDRSSPVMRKDFHPIHQSLVVWGTSKCTLELTIALTRAPTIPINRVSRSFDGSLLGITYSKHLVHTNAYLDGRDIQQHSMIAAVSLEDMVVIMAAVLNLLPSEQEARASD